MPEENGEETAAEMIKKSIMLERIGKKNDRIAELEAQLSNIPDTAKLERRLQKAEALAEQTTTEFDAYRKEAETRSVLTAAGITDPDDQDLVRWRHGRLEGDSELADFVKGDAKKDRQLQHLFAEKKADAPEANDPAPKTPAPTGNSNNGAKPPPPPASAYSPEAIMAMPYGPERTAAVAKMNEGG